MSACARRKWILITPTGIPYEDTKREHIVPMALDGTHAGNVLPSSEWRFHRDIYASRPDVQAIVHTMQFTAPRSQCMVAAFRLSITWWRLLAVRTSAARRTRPSAHRSFPITRSPR